jgi:hypothetical protein
VSGPERLGQIVRHPAAKPAAVFSDAGLDVIRRSAIVAQSGIVVIRRAGHFDAVGPRHLPVQKDQGRMLEACQPKRARPSFAVTTRNPSG